MGWPLLTVQRCPNCQKMKVTHRTGSWPSGPRLLSLGLFCRSCLPKAQPALRGAGEPSGDCPQEGGPPGLPPAGSSEAVLGSLARHTSRPTGGPARALGWFKEVSSALNLWKGKPCPPAHREDQVPHGAPPAGAPVPLCPVWVSNLQCPEAQDKLTR